MDKKKRVGHLCPGIKMASSNTADETTPLSAEYTRLPFDDATDYRKGGGNDFGIDLVFLRRLRRIYRIALPPLWSRDAFFIVLLIVMIFPPMVTQFMFAIMPGWILRTLIERDLHRFIAAMSSTALVALLDSILSGLNFFLVLYVGVRLRNRLTTHLHDRYVSNKHLYYQLAVKDNNIDNPDQRIQSDVANITVGLVTVICILCSSVMQIAFYSVYVTYKVGMHCTAVIYAYYIFSTLVNRVLMAPIVKLTYNQDRLEGFFRYNHATLRACAESVAFSGGEAEVKHGLASDLAAVLRNQHKKILRESFLNFFGSVVSNGNSLMGFFIAGMTVFNNPAFASVKQSEMGEVLTQLTSVIGNLSGAFTELINAAPLVAELAGNTSRVGHMLEVMDEMEEQHDLYELRCMESRQQMQASQNCIMAIRDVSCAMPSGTLIVKNLTISINAREHLVIHGPSGCGKTTLLRFMKGLWFLKNRHGSFDSQLMHSSTAGIMFCPQDPFVFPSTLQSLITFPRDSPHLQQASWETTGSSAIHAAFERLELNHLIDPAHGWFTRRNWSQELSLGEKQRISFLRILYHRPQLAILDESTSALSTELETICYSVIKEAGTFVLFSMLSSFFLSYLSALQELPSLVSRIAPLF